MVGRTRYADPLVRSDLRCTIGNNVLWNVPLTPITELVAPRIDRLPRDIREAVESEYWQNFEGDVAPSWEKTYAERERLARQVAQFEAEKVHVAFDESEIRERASRAASLCARMGRLEPMQEYALSLGIEPPKPDAGGNRTRVGCAKRLTDEHWWRRAFRRTYTRRAESHLRAVGFVHKRRQVYASDRAVQVHQQRHAANKRTLQSLVAVSDAGDQLELWEVRERSTANAAIRRGELMTRMRGFEELAKEAGHVALFLTLTTPSAFHRTHVTGHTNERWEGFTPRDGQAWLCKQWARARAALARRSVIYYGLRIAEPHHDGTPHWHMVVFTDASNVEALKTIVREHWLSEYGEEHGARDHRCEFVHIDPQKGSAVGYVAKYVAKNVDGFAVGDDIEAEKPATESARRVAAWAAAHGIRQFQQLGGPQVSVWRECRRVDSAQVQMGPIAEAVRAADAGEWATFVRAVGGIEAGRRGAVQLWKDQTGELTRYDECRPEQVVGIEMKPAAHCWCGAWIVNAGHCESGHRGDRIITRTKCWRIQRKERIDATAVGALCRSETNWIRSGSASSLGPVSITVRGTENVPASTQPARGYEWIAMAPFRERGVGWRH